jgi:hypothetical protein
MQDQDIDTDNNQHHHRIIKKLFIGIGRVFEKIVKKLFHMPIAGRRVEKKSDSYHPLAEHP